MSVQHCRPSLPKEQRTVQRASIKHQLALVKLEPHLHILYLGSFEDADSYPAVYNDKKFVQSPAARW